MVPRTFTEHHWPFPETNLSTCFLVSFNVCVFDPGNTKASPGIKICRCWYPSNRMARTENCHRKNRCMRIGNVNSPSRDFKLQYYNPKTSKNRGASPKFGGRFPWMMHCFCWGPDGCPKGWQRASQRVASVFGSGLQRLPTGASGFQQILLIRTFEAFESFWKRKHHGSHGSGTAIRFAHDSVQPVPQFRSRKSFIKIRLFCFARNGSLETEPKRTERNHAYHECCMLPWGNIGIWYRDEDVSISPTRWRFGVPSPWCTLKFLLLNNVLQKYSIYLFESFI